ncbi:run domain Beclin-1-interacting and cysteine-rich domain-containing protein-like [Nomascus leucogenys]|uniref:run domain Beclin-1-interacting and cysteine-rich domain-containing protein-like n=1 Tax=Nomascus leucogenys TaxID=61853 RepID=UPI00122D6CF0|nr:run domain Beclin-1-interacting and cysteine-rich domain-containing protein-like [Nomascus leucogenys]
MSAGPDGVALGLGCFIHIPFPTEGGRYLCSGEGTFRRPSEGQSLISYLSEQDFGSCADLEKENAHFSISESLIAAIELMKCNMMSQCLEEEGVEEEDSDREIQELKQKIRLRRQQIRTKNLLPMYQEAEHGSQWSLWTLLFPHFPSFRHKAWCPNQWFLCCQKDISM